MDSKSINYKLNLRKISFDQVEVGYRTYGVINAYGFGNSQEKLYIGNYCSIAENVIFLLGGEHKYSTLSTFPFKNKLLNELETKTKGEIIVEDDVWIGYDSLILSGVRIGQGAIIGARSVVSKNIPPYAIFAGDKIIKFRFEKKFCEKLNKFDFSTLNDDEIINNINLLTRDIDSEFFDSDFYKEHLKKEIK